jgi:predicted metal-dependent hydrolase
MNSRHYSLNLFDILIEVTHKKIKHLHLRISSPEGKVTVSAPMRMSEETIRIFCMSKLEWMCASREKFKNRKQEEPKQYLSGEVHSYLGKNYVLEVTEQDTRPKIYLDGEILKFSVRPDTTTEKKETLLHDWYKEQL